MNALKIRILTNHDLNEFFKCTKQYPNFVYTFAHNITNVPLMAHSMLNVYSHTRTDIIHFLLGNDSFNSGVSSYEENKHMYNQVVSYNMCKIPYFFDTINTRIEAEAVISFLVQEYHLGNSAIKNIELLVCAPAFHIQRAFMTFVSVLIDFNVDKYIYAIPCTATVWDWTEHTISHQGRTCCTYFEMIEKEEKRIFAYTNKGDIRDKSEIWDYLESWKKL